MVRPSNVELETLNFETRAVEEMLSCVYLLTCCFLIQLSSTFDALAYEMKYTSDIDLVLSLPKKMKEEMMLCFVANPARITLGEIILPNYQP